jgi:hypothetical protein
MTFIIRHVGLTGSCVSLLILQTMEKNDVEEENAQGAE